MLPYLPIRVLIATGAVLGGVCWLWALPTVMPADASTGISLFDAAAGPVPAVGMLLLAGLPAIGFALAAGTAGNPLSGPFVAAFSLMILAGRGGSSRGWLWRADLPGAYTTLIGETLLWSAALVGLILAIGVCRRAAHRRYPNLASWSLADPPPAPPEGPGGWRHIRGADALAGLVAAVIGYVLCGLLIQNAATGQVIGSLVLAFTLASLLAQLLVPHHNPLPILLAPAVAAIAGYTLVLLSPALVDTPAVLEAWYTRQLSGPALALPIQYLSAGVVGCTIGSGIGYALGSASKHERERYERAAAES